VKTLVARYEPTSFEAVDENCRNYSELQRRAGREELGSYERSPPRL
jgi:hypothetical protein